MNSKVVLNYMDKLGELMEKGTQKKGEMDIDGREVSIDTVWISLLIAQSEIIVLLEDIKKVLAERKSNRFELIDINEGQ